MNAVATKRRAYTHARQDIAFMMTNLGIGGARVLDVGCSTGATGTLIAERFGCTVTGIELDPELAEAARTCLAEVNVGDANEQLATLAARGTEFDVVLFADILEHLVDPWQAIDLAIDLLSGGGWIVTSLPNAAHIGTIWSLLRGTWPMRASGIHDDTHIRFFARRDIARLVERDRSRVERVKSNFQLRETSSRLNRWSRYVGRLWPNVFTYQYLVVVRVDPEAPLPVGAPEATASG